MGKASRDKKQRWSLLVQKHGVESALKIRNESRLTRKRNNLLKAGTFSPVVKKDKDGNILQTTDRFSNYAKNILGIK